MNDLDIICTIVDNNCSVMEIPKAFIKESYHGSFILTSSLCNTRTLPTKFYVIDDDNMHTYTDLHKHYWMHSFTLVSYKRL